MEYLKQVIKPPKGFALDIGMNDKQIIDILKDNVAGESQQMVHEFFDIKYDEATRQALDDMNEILGLGENTNNNFVVLAADKDTGYGVLQKLFYRMDGNRLKVSKKLYFCGNSDDDSTKFFMHELDDWGSGRLKPIINGTNISNLSDLVNWIDKKDEGFTGRIQGDIVYMIRSYDDVSSAGVLSLKREINSSFVGSQYHYDRRYGRNGEPYPSIKTHAHIFVSGVGAKRDDVGIEFGRHMIMSDGGIEDCLVDANYAGTFQDQYFVVHGSKLAIKHPEHKVTRLDIPAGHFVVLTNQRGRPRLDRKPRHND